MFSDSDSGIISILLCLAVLVFSGIFLSLLADKHLEKSGRKTDELLQIGKNETTIKQLGEDGKIAEKQLEQMARESKTRKTTKQATSEFNAKLKAEIRILKSKKIRAEIQRKKLHQEFKDYVSSYKDFTWRKSVGQRIDYLFLKSGRRLDKIIISNVSPAGLSVSHSGGFARLKPTELSLKIRDRFQWSFTVPELRE